jgi:uncharacterized lipoprotein NlpE involved in copper resistance
MRKTTVPIALAIVLLAATVVAAAPASQDGEEYIVQAGDWLSKIAGNVYNDILAYPAIVRATNAKALANDSFAVIYDPDRIEVGQKLWIPASDESAGELSLMDLMNATYSGIYDEPVQLDNGQYQGEPFVPGGASRPTVTLANYAFGQLNEDSIADAAVILVENSGGSGSFYYLAAMVSQEGGFANAATTLLGDRLQVRSLSVDDGEITLQTITHGPDDPMCCPTLELTFTYSLQGDRLVETSVGDIALADLQNGVYQGVYDQPVQLAGGRYEGKPFVEGGSSRPTVVLAAHTFGDLNGDGATDAAVALVENSGGSGSFWYLAALVNEDGQLVNTATQLLGDRWQVREMSVLGGLVHLDVVTHGPDDPMCCPTLEMSFAYALRGNLLMETSPRAQGMYKGFLPAATCCGRDLTLYLNADSSANLHTDYLNGQPAVVEIGSWRYGAGGSVVLTLTGQADAPYEAPVVITYDLGEQFLTPTEFDEQLYGSFGPGKLMRFEVLGWEQKAPPYNEAAAEKAVADSGFVGIYKGFLPAATCCGQDIALSLALDGTAKLRTDYLNGETPFVEVGTWQAYDDGKGLTLTITGNEASPGVEPRTYDPALVWEFAWEAATLNKVESDELSGSLGLRLFHLIGLVAATMGQ